MHGSVEYWITGAYRKNPPRVAAIAEDALPSRKIQKVIDELTDRWTKRSNDAADNIAYSFLNSLFSTSEKAFQSSLKEAGWAVKFEMTPAMRDAFNASLEENIGLIRSIPEKRLQKISSIVMRSYSSGRGIKTMIDEIRSVYTVTLDRAVLIARDQSNKANSVVNRVRELELGITEAIWMFSHDGKEPRQSHVAANGKRYKITEGFLIGGEYIQPGEISIRARRLGRANRYSRNPWM